ncbi:MAG: hypothetical protein QXU81_09940 [Candidatus Bathyarchaeia archaeon]
MVDGFSYAAGRSSADLFQGGTFLARLFLTNVKDPVSGFFALRREVIEDADLRPEGA